MAFDPNLTCDVDGYAGEMVLIDVAQSCGTVADPRALPYVPIGGSTDTNGSVQFANGLHDFVQQRKTGCSVVAVNTVTDVVGPSYTAEGRPVFELNFEMMYQS